MSEPITVECKRCDEIFKLHQDQPHICPGCFGGLTVLTRAVKVYCTCESPFGCDVHDGAASSPDGREAK